MSSETPSGPLARTREQMARLLNHALEEEVTLSATMRGILGRVTGAPFHSVYRLLGDQCRQIDQWLAEIGDRARAFGLTASAAAASVPAPASPATAEGLSRTTLGELLALHEGIAHRLRADLAQGAADAATRSLLDRLVDFHETTAWMLRMLLEGPEVPRAGS